MGKGNKFLLDYRNCEKEKGKINQLDVGNEKDQFQDFTKQW